MDMAEICGGVAANRAGRDKVPPHCTKKSILRNCFGEGIFENE